MCRFSVWKVRNRRNGKKCRTFVWNSERNVFPSAHTHTQKMIVLSPIFRTLQNAIDAIFTPFFYSTRNRHHIQTHCRANDQIVSIPTWIFQHKIHVVIFFLWPADKWTNSRMLNKFPRSHSLQLSFTLLAGVSWDSGAANDSTYSPYNALLRLSFTHQLNWIHCH